MGEGAEEALETLGTLQGLQGKGRDVQGKGRGHAELCRSCAGDVQGMCRDVQEMYRGCEGMYRDVPLEQCWHLGRELCRDFHPLLEQKLFWLLPKLPDPSWEMLRVREETRLSHSRDQTNPTLLETLGESDTEELGSVRTRFVQQQQGTQQ